MIYERFLRKKGQGTLEYLLLIGGAVLVAVIVISLVVSLGGQSRDTAQDQSTKAQSALDFSLPVDIVKIEPHDDSCSNDGLGAFTVFYNPLGEGGVHEIVVEDYTNSIVPLSSDGKLPGNSYQATIIIDLSGDPNLKCTDIFRAHIKTTKNEKEIYSTPKSFFWKKNAGVSAIFDPITPTSGTYFDSNPTLNFNVNLNGYNGSNVFEWYLESTPTLISACNNKTSCEITVPNGVHQVNFKAYENNISEDPVIDQRSSEMYVCDSSDCSLSLDSFKTSLGTNEFHPDQTITLVTDISSDLGSSGDYVCAYFEKNNSVDLGSNDCSNFSFNSNSLNGGALGNYVLTVNVLESNTQLEVIDAGSLNLTLVEESASILEVEVTAPQDGDFFFVGEKINFNLNVSGGSTPYICSWFENEESTPFFKNNCSNFEYGFSNSGEKTISLNVMDAGKITAETSFDINVFEPDYFVANIISPEDGSSYNVKDTISLNSEIIGAFSPFTCSWIIGDQMICKNCNCTYTLGDKLLGEVPVILDVVDSKGNNIGDEIIITINK